MSEASGEYTPSLEVTENTEVIRRRELPIRGEVCVTKGAQLRPTDVVLRAELPGELHIVRLLDILGIPSEQLEAGLRVKIGDKVSKGSHLFQSKSFFNLFTLEAMAPVSGAVEFIQSELGHLGLRAAPEKLELRAFVRGEVIEIEDGRAVIIRSRCALVQGIFGVGGESIGTLHTLDIPLDAVVKAEMLANAPKNAIIVGGKSWELSALECATTLGTRGVVTGSVEPSILHSYVGAPITMAATGDEAVPFPLVVTEGFGSLPLSERVFHLTKKNSGAEASITGATQVRAGATRPELLITPKDPGGGIYSAPSRRSLTLQSRVRIVREPYFGVLATVTELPREPQSIPSGAQVRVVCCALQSGEVVTVPRSNIELL